MDYLIGQAKEPWYNYYIIEVSSLEGFFIPGGKQETKKVVSLCKNYGKIESNNTLYNFSTLNSLIGQGIFQ